MKKLFIYVLTVMILAPGIVLAERKSKAPAKAVKSEEPACTAEMLMNASTGEILNERNIHEPLRPASMVKLMLAYVVYHQVEQKNVNWDDLITASAFASKVGGSQVYLKQGEQFTLSQLLEAVLIQSANDAAVAIAEHVSGDSAGFVQLMNDEAKSLGMTESKFNFPHGLPPADGQEEDRVSAHDFGILARALLAKYPQVLELTAKQSAPFRGGEFQMTNHNHLLRTFNGADGLKTGYYGEAGFSVTATAQRNGVRLIAVVMGCNNRKFRDAQAAKLLSTGFAQFKSVKLVEKGAAVEGVVAVKNGQKAQTQPVTAAEGVVVVKKGEEAAIVKKLELCEALQAPVARETACGKLSFYVGEQLVGSVPLMIAEEIGERTGLGKLLGYVGM